MDGGWQTSVDVSTGLVSLIGADLGPRLKKKKKDRHILKYGVSVISKEDGIELACIFALLLLEKPRIF